MTDTKTVFRFFSIFAYRKEEVFLSEMHKKGWRLESVTFPGFYHFRKCDPCNAVYRLDYNPGSKDDNAGYIQLFSDCGWDYLFDFCGYSYFCKEGESDSHDDEIFCDDESRLDMMHRVFRRRLTPLIILFCLVMVPMFLMYTLRSDSPARDFLSFEMLILIAVYLVIFTVSAVHLCRYEIPASGNNKNVRIKYIGIFTLLAAMFISTVTVFCIANRSEYEVKDTSAGFIIEADRLNCSVTREYDLKRGDIVIFEEHMDKLVHFEIRESGKDAVFYCNFQLNGPESYTIQNDGHYRIKVSARRAAGIAEVTVR